VTKVRWVLLCGFCSKFHKLWKSVKIWQSYTEFKGGNYFWDTVYIHCVYVSLVLVKIETWNLVCLLIAIGTKQQWSVWFLLALFKLAKTLSFITLYLFHRNSADLRTAVGDLCFAGLPSPMISYTNLAHIWS